MISLLLIRLAEFVPVLELASQVQGTARSLSNCLKIASTYEINHCSISSAHPYKTGKVFLCGVSDPNHVKSLRKKRNWLICLFVVWKPDKSMHVEGNINFSSASWPSSTSATCCGPFGDILLLISAMLIQSKLQKSCSNLE